MNILESCALNRALRLAGRFWLVLADGQDRRDRRHQWGLGGRVSKQKGRLFLLH